MTVELSDPYTVSALTARLSALDRFCRAADGLLPDEALAPGRYLVEKALGRLNVTGGRTVVALAGSTGSGKSSLFNALARMSLSPVGALRPTTGVVHACVWGSEESEPLLDWLGVDAGQRFYRESPLDADDEAGLRGMVLLDLPDVDSVVAAHRLEAERMLDLTDLLVWVVDPQKYADQLLHDWYLRGLTPLRKVTVVVLNQVDLLAPIDVRRCLDDLSRLLDADGMVGVPVFATSAATGDGLTELRKLLERVVEDRRAGLARLAGDVSAVLTGLTPLAGPDLPDDAVSRDDVRDLADRLATASGVDAVAAARADEYAHRTALPGWSRRGSLPAQRPVRRSTDGTLRLRPAAPGSGSGADPAAVGLAVRGLADVATADLPQPWAEAVRAASRTQLQHLPDELGEVVRTTDPGPLPRRGWLFARGLWWLAAATALAGIGWGIAWLAGATDPPVWLGVRAPVWLAVGGVVAASLLSLLAAPVRRRGRERVRTRTARRLNESVATVARERVVAPVRGVLRSYVDANAALASAQGLSPPGDRDRDPPGAELHRGTTARSADARDGR